MAGYLDDDDQYAALLAPTFNPQEEPAPQSGVKPMTGISRPPDGGAVRSIAPPVQPSAPAPAQPVAPPAAIPAAASPTGNPSSGPSLRDQLKASLARQSQSVQGAEASTAQLQAQPDESAATAPLEAQRTQLAQPIDPTQQKYKPGLATRIFRGIDAVRRGGVLGAFDPADVGAKAYGAPNRQFDIDTQQQQQKLGAVDQQLSQSAAAYKATSDRAKAIAQEMRSNATGENDIQKNINTSEKGGQQYQEAIAKLGQKEVDDPDNPGSKKLVDDPESAAYKNRQDLDNYRQGMEKVAELKASVEKEKITPGTPAWNQRQQSINAQSQKAQAYLGNYLQRSKNVDLGGGTLPGAPQIGNDEGGRTVVGTGNAATAIKNQSKVAQFNDVHGALDSLEDSAKALVKSGGKLNSPRVAAALAQPHGTLSQWLQGEGAKSGMSKEERDYVIANAAAHENIQAMRPSAGGTSTDSSVAKLDALIPNASTPDIDYFLKQTGQIRSTAQRLGTGVTTAAGGSNLRNGSAGGGNKGGDIPSAAAKQLQEGKVHTFNNGQQWTLQSGKPVRVK